MSHRSKQRGNKERPKETREPSELQQDVVFPLDSWVFLSVSLLLHASHGSTPGSCSHEIETLAAAKSDKWSPGKSVNSVAYSFMFMMFLFAPSREDPRRAALLEGASRAKRLQLISQTRRGIRQSANRLLLYSASPSAGRHR